MHFLHLGALTAGVPGKNPSLHCCGHPQKHISQAPWLPQVIDCAVPRAAPGAALLLQSVTTRSPTGAAQPSLCRDTGTLPAGEAGPLSQVLWHWEAGCAVASSPQAGSEQLEGCSCPYRCPQHSPEDLLHCQSLPETKHSFH